MTIFIFNRDCIFEEFPRLKHLVEKQWEIIFSRHEKVILDEHVIMPNQLHGIIVITESATDATATTGIRAENKAGIETRAGATLAGALECFSHMRKSGVSNVFGVFREIPGSVWKTINLSVQP